MRLVNQNLAKTGCITAARFSSQAVLEIELGAPLVSLALILKSLNACETLFPPCVDVQHKRLRHV
jgi:hypothetical protein